MLADVLGENGHAAPDLATVHGMIGDGARVLIERAVARIGAELDVDALNDRFRQRYAEVPCRHSVPYPGATALLRELRAAGMRLGLCTNKPQAATLGLLEALGLMDAFDAVIGGDLIKGVRKPDPAHLRAVLAALEAPGSSAVMVGDSRNDLLAARGAAIPCVLVSFGYTAVPARELGADAVIDRLDQLPALLESVS
ncbi:MAG: HAD-IA family hydrolase [Geminicoccaceae bacterium]